MIICNPHFFDGSTIDPPRFSLEEKWNRLYPPKYGSNCEGYSCMNCSSCPKGTYWKVPDEDKEEWNNYKKFLHDYYDQHGGFRNIEFDFV